MPDPSDPALEIVVRAVQSGARYHSISEELIRALARRELSADRRPKDAIKATKSKLHQITGAFADEALPGADWLEELRRASNTGDDKRLRRVCLAAMVSHASTRERMSILSPFFATVLGGLPPIRSIIDVGCGLNPLAIPWMPLAADCAYHAYDIDGALTDLLNQFFAITTFRGRADMRDVVSAPPDVPVDVALVFKVLPVLEQIEKGASLRLLRALNAPVLLVSFPAMSLGGRNKGMASNYEARFRALVSDEHWRLERHSFFSELVFVIHKDEMSPAMQAWSAPAGR